MAFARRDATVTSSAAICGGVMFVRDGGGEWDCSGGVDQDVVSIELEDLWNSFK